MTGVASPATSEKTIKAFGRLAGAVFLLCFLQSCATNPTDRFERLNRSSFQFNESLDQAIVLPIARNYAAVIPGPVATGVTNFFDNLFYLNTALNNFLQGKVGQSVSDLGRILVNTTFGLGGLLDVATHLRLEKHEEDLGQTLAVWGVPAGAYLYLPLAGPYNLRSLSDIPMRGALNPLFYTHASVAIPMIVLNFVNRRANLIERTDIRDSSALDTYIFTREAFQQQREFQIYDGAPPADNFDELFDL